MNDSFILKCSRGQNLIRFLSGYWFVNVAVNSADSAPYFVCNGAHG